MTAGFLLHNEAELNELRDFWKVRRLPLHMGSICTHWSPETRAYRYYVLR